MLSDRFVYLVSKKLSSALTIAEEEELNLLLQQDNNSNNYQMLKRFWGEKQKSGLPNVEAALQKVLQNIHADDKMEEATETKQESNRFAWKRPAVLASAFAILIIGFLLYFVFHQSPANGSVSQPLTAAKGLVEKQNAKGTRSVIALADGSKVWLNADSRLQYPTAFEGTTREVYLSGEAFFDVSKNKLKPFIIHLKNGTVKVLGTSFNIKAYDHSPLVETSVSTGRVAFVPAGVKKADTTFLTKDMKAVYIVAVRQVKTMPTTSSEDKAWTEGRLIFHDTSMEEIATQLERYFGKTVLIADDEIRNYRLTGTFENNSAEEILYYLSKSKPFTYTVGETQITLSLVH